MATDEARQWMHDVVFPIRISTPFAVGDVYCYLLKDDKVVLVDCGHKAEASLARIEEAMDRQGMDLQDLEEIWLTHGHPDHFGQASLIADRSGAELFGHSKERANFACNDDRELFADFFRRHHIPGKAIDMMIDQLDWLQQFQDPVEPNWVAEGDRLTSGSLTVDVKHAPGHAPGHVMYREESGLIFGGDVLLEHISTNALINFDPDTAERNRSLLQYRESLEWTRRQEGLLLPGHGEFIEDIGTTAAHHLEEHETRYRNIHRLLEEQSYSLFELAMNTFYESLMKGDAFLVLSEVLGYLDWGIERNELVKVEKDGQIAYRARDGG